MTVGKKNYKKIKKKQKKPYQAIGRDVAIRLKYLSNTKKILLKENQQLQTNFYLQTNQQLQTVDTFISTSFLMNFQKPIFNLPKVN